MWWGRRFAPQVPPARASMDSGYLRCCHHVYCSAVLCFGGPQL